MKVLMRLWNIIGSVKNVTKLSSPMNVESKSVQRVSAK